MKIQVSHTALALFIGAALIAAPAIIGAKGALSYNQAFAGPGKSGDHGGGKGKSGDHGKSGGKAKKSAATEEEEEEEEEEPKIKKAKLASKLGALNAYHASPKAFKNAAPNSRVGRIAAYWDKLQEYEKDGITEVEQAELDGLLDAAANKPLDAETREAFNNLLHEKFAEEEDDSEDGDDETQ